jgi:acyl-CoA dehydrogenase
MTADAVRPLSFDAPSPSEGASEYLQDPSVRLLIDFFQTKGLEALKREDRQEDWYQDWIDYQARHGIYAGLLSPRQYSSRGHQFSISRLVRFLEVFAYFNPAHGYSLHVSFLGLFPILTSDNEPLKREAVARLEAGGLFAFGVSEKAHGSDLFANEFLLTPAPTGGWTAEGSKYYIGNANAACIVSVLAKKGGPEAAGSSRRMPFVFVAIRPGEAPAYQDVRKIRTLGIRSAFVGEFTVKGHPVPEGDVISQGRQAWDAGLDTVNLGKFFLGFGAVGICERAFTEAVAHLRRRILYGKPVSDMPHVRAATAHAFARLTAMKLYAYRALDCLQAASPGDRRYLLFNAVQKARVSTQGVRVMALLSECVGARGFEAATYFESALREVQLIPALEGSTHINFALTAQFVANYFAGSDEVTPPEPGVLREGDPGENPYWFEAGDRNPRTVRFGLFLSAYRPLRSLPNVQLFVRQAKAFRRFAAAEAAQGAAQPGKADAATAIAIGKCFSTIAFAQLVAESCAAARVEPTTVSVIFHGLIEDLREESLTLAATFPRGSAQRAALKGAVRVPRTEASDVESVFAAIASRYGAEDPSPDATPS